MSILEEVKQLFKTPPELVRTETYRETDIFKLSVTKELCERVTKDVNFIYFRIDTRKNKKEIPLLTEEQIINIFLGKDELLPDYLTEIRTFDGNEPNNEGDYFDASYADCIRGRLNYELHESNDFDSYHGKIKAKNEVESNEVKMFWEAS